MEFSIIVPTYNRPRQLADCLAALARLDYARDRFEVVVVDDGSSTPLEGVTAGFRPALLVRGEWHAARAAGRCTECARGASIG